MQVSAIACPLPSFWAGSECFLSLPNECRDSDVVRKSVTLGQMVEVLLLPLSPRNCVTLASYLTLVSSFVKLG